MALHFLRILCYVALFLFSAVLFGLCAARLYYTTHLPAYDPLNNGHKFYDPIVAELIITTAMTMLWSPVIAHAVHTRHESRKRHLFSFLFELLGLGILFIFWIVGAGIATSLWGNLHFCHMYRACRILTALVAFTWMGVIMLLALIVMSALFAISNRAFHEPLHGQWDPRESHYRDSRASGGIFPQMRSSRA